MPPFSDDALRRIRMTVSCGDCATIPKVANAGQIADGVQTMHNGVRIRADGYCGPWMTEVIRRLRGHHEPQEEWAFQQLLHHVRPGTRILELGSYWAYYTLWFLRAVPYSRATLVEPDPAYRAVGEANFALNDATGEFLDGCIGEESHATTEFFRECGIVHRTRQFTVDELLSRPGAEPAEILLADIQGAELRMLHGARESVRSGRIRFLVLSTHHHSIAGDPLMHERCLEFVRDHGGHALAHHDVAESFSGDGLIVASFDPRDRDLPPIRVSRNRAADSLFRPVEYDLAEAWETIAELKRERRDPPHRGGAMKLLRRVWQKATG